MPVRIAGVRSAEQSVVSRNSKALPSLLVRGLTTLISVQTLVRSHFPSGKCAKYECLQGLREHAVRSNP